MICLVTGAAGFIGSHLCERLVADGHTVRGVDNFTDYYEPARKRENLASLAGHDRFELVEADIEPTIVDGVDAVYHLAGQPGVRGSWGPRFDEYVRNNIAATQVLLEALKDRPVPTVYASSSSVYGAVEEFPAREDARPQPISPYGVTKLAAEHLAVLYARAYEVPVTAVRYFTVFGPRQRPDMAFTRFVTAALDGGTIEVYGTGEQTRDFTYIDDAVDATVRALDGEPGRVYNVGGGNHASVNECIAIIEGLVGSRVRVEHRPPAPGDPADTSADTTRARTELGWEPKTSLREGLGAQVDWLRQR